MDTLVIRTPEDIPALVPKLLGFWPTRSAVMLAVGGPVQFHARVDMAPRDDNGFSRPEPVADALLPPCEQHGVAGVILLVVDGTIGEVNALRDKFTDAGIEVPIAAAITDAGRDYVHIDSDHGGWIVDRPHVGTRDDMAKKFQPHGDTAQEYPVGINDFTRENAKEHLMRMELLLARSKPNDPDTGILASKVAVAAWLEGNGAKAWVAVDIARECGENSLADLMASVLERAIPPSSWDYIRATRAIA